MDSKHARFWTSDGSRTPDEVQPGYSSSHKAFYSVVPASTQSFQYMPVSGEFGISRLSQRDVLTVVKENPRDPNKLLDPYEVSLVKVISQRLRQVGLVMDEDGAYQGGCFLIAQNLAVVARHTLEGENVKDFRIRFGHIAGNTDAIMDCRILNILEDDPELDYAVVELDKSPGLHFGYLEMSAENVYPTELALLHYPLGKQLQVSVHAVQQIEYATKFLLPFHDSDFGSSGCPYISPNGKCVAFHLGSELEEDVMGFNLQRYAIETAEIVSKRPNSCIASLARKELDPTESYSSKTSCMYLNYVKREFLEVEMKPKRKMREERKARQEKINRAINNTQVRLATYDRNEYEVMSARDLVAFFPNELGQCIFNHQDHTHTNKTIFRNPHTGWYVCYDKLGQYNTVHDQNNQYVALDGGRSPNGQDAKFHFRNTAAPLQTIARAPNRPA